MFSIEAPHQDGGSGCGSSTGKARGDGTLPLAVVSCCGCTGCALDSQLCAGPSLWRRWASMTHVKAMSWMDVVVVVAKLKTGRCLQHRVGVCGASLLLTSKQHNQAWEPVPHKKHA